MLNDENHTLFIETQYQKQRMRIQSVIVL